MEKYQHGIIFYHKTLTREECSSRNWSVGKENSCGLSIRVWEVDIYFSCTYILLPCCASYFSGICGSVYLANDGGRMSFISKSRKRGAVKKSKNSRERYERMLHEIDVAEDKAMMWITIIVVIAFIASFGAF